MKILLFTVTFLALAVVTTLLFINIDGTVIVDVAGRSLQLPLVMVIGGILLTYLLLYFLFRAFSLLKRVPGALGRKRKRGQFKKSRASLKRGLLEMVVGNWSKAERSLSSSAEKSDLPLLNYLSAARVAQQQGKIEQRDTYLTKAMEVDPEASLAVGLTQAELMFNHGQYDEEMATLNQLNQDHPGNALVQKYLAKNLHARQDWQELSEVLPALEKNKSVNAAEIKSFNTDTYCSLLKQHADQDDREAFDAVWKGVPKRVRQYPAVVKCYIKQLIKFDDAKTAGPFIRKYLKSNWDEDVVALYSELNIGDHKVGLAQAEKWLKEHPESPGLLAMAGFLNAKAELWGRARSLLEQSLAIKPRAQSYKLLGDVLSSMDEKEAAMESYNTGLKLAVAETS